jgi:DNA-binding transcriptional LysR family regulator
MRGATSGRVAGGTTPAGAAWIVPSALERFSVTKPDAGVTVMEMNLPIMLGALRAGDLDMVIAPIANDDSIIEFVAEELYRDRLCAIVNSRHPAAAVGKIALAALFEYPWIVPPVRTRPGILVRAMFRRNELDLPSSHIETQSISVARELLLTGTLPWIAALPSDFFREDQRQGRMRTIALPHGGHSRPVGVLQRARAARSPLVNAFLACLREAAASDRQDVAIARVAAKSRPRVATSAACG